MNGLLAAARQLTVRTESQACGARQEASSTWIAVVSQTLIVVAGVRAAIRVPSGLNATQSPCHQLEERVDFRRDGASQILISKLPKPAVFHPD